MNAVSGCIDCLSDLIRFPSVSDRSNVEINDYVAAELCELGFDVRRQRYTDWQGVDKDNLIARRDPLRGGSSAVDQETPRGLAYFCHTDVVPADDWQGPGGDPFRPVLTGDRLFGRGACDMKGSLAVMLSAVRRIDAPAQTRPLWIVCTADEETGFEGARQLTTRCDAYRELVRHQPLSIIGEPTSLGVVHAHKGIRVFHLTSRGRAAHSSTSLGVNANLAMVPVLQTMWEIEAFTRSSVAHQDDRFDPPTLSWTFGFSDHMRTNNITPSRCDAWCSLRTMPGIDGQDLIARVATRAAEMGVVLTPHGGCDPLWLDPDSPVLSRVCEVVGQTSHTVCYATDGGLLGGLRHRVVIGPGDIAQAHTADEWIAVDQIDRGIEVFHRLLSDFVCG